jgi:chaperonin cofactor prefoldin
MPNDTLEEKINDLRVRVETLEQQVKKMELAPS